MPAPDMDALLVDSQHALITIAKVLAKHHWEGGWEDCPNALEAIAGIVSEQGFLSNDYSEAM